MKKTIQIADKQTLDETKSEAVSNSAKLSKLFERTMGGLTCVSKYEENTVIVAQKKKISTLPYPFDIGCAVVYHDEIHCFGSTVSATYMKCHYKWDGNKWTNVSTIPYTFACGCAVVYHDEIHLLGGSTSYNPTAHYKWDGSEWTKVSTIPYMFQQGCAVVYHDEIHCFGSSTNAENGQCHYKWDGNEWTKVGLLPQKYSKGCAVVYHDEIHLFDESATSYLMHYSFNGMKWNLVTASISCDFSTSGYGKAIVYDNEIILFLDKICCRFVDDTVFIKQENPMYFSGGCAVVYHDEIHCLGGNNASNADNRYNHNTTEVATDCIQLYLKKGNEILCDVTKIRPITNNLEDIDGGYVCTETGLCKFICKYLQSNILYTVI